MIGVFNTAFDLKVAKTEKSASVNHLQHFAGDQASQLTAIKANMTTAGYHVGNRSAYAVVGVGAVEDCGTRCNATLTIFRKPEAGNPSHSELRGLPADNSNLDLRESLAQLAGRRLIGAGDI